MAAATAVCMLALIEYIVFGFLVGKARGTYGVAAPATTGHPEFDRYYRVHINTLEQLATFVPALFAFAWFIGDLWAAAVGLVFVFGRALYARQYIADPASRGPGMALTFLPNMILLFGGLGGAVMAAFGLYL